MSLSIRPASSANFDTQQILKELESLPLETQTLDQQAILSPQVRRIANLLTEGFEILKEAGLSEKENCEKLKATLLTGKPLKSLVGENAERTIDLLKAAGKAALLNSTNFPRLMENAKYAKGLSSGIRALQIHGLINQGNFNELCDRVEHVNKQ